MIKFQFGDLEWKKRFVYMKNVPFDEVSLNQKGAKFQIIRFLPNTRIWPHFHKNVCEIFYIRSGKGTLIFNGEKYQAEKDDIFLCQPNDIHEIINDSNEELVILTFKTNEESGDIFWLESEDQEKYGK